MAQTFNTILSFVKSTSRKDRRKGVGSLSVSAVAGGGVGSAADSATQAWVRDNFVDKTTEQEISALKIFSQGIKIGDVSLFKHPDGYVYLDETLVLKGGVVMYGDDGTTVKPIWESIPLDESTLAWLDGKLSVIGGVGSGGGISEEFLNATLQGYQPKITSSNKLAYSLISGTPDLSVYAKTSDMPSLSGYATQSWVENKGYLPSKRVTFTPAETAIGPADVLSKLGSGYALGKGTWSFATNGYISKDTTGSIAIDLAGCSVIQLGDSGTYTQLYITAEGSTTEYSKTNEILFYNDNGSSYAPSWTRVLTNRNYSEYCSSSGHTHNYLPLSGGTLTGDVTFSSKVIIDGISLRKVDNHLYIDSSLVLSGGVTMYGDDGTTVKPIWESIPLDESTLAWLDGKLSVIGGVGSGGGISEEFLNATLQGYQPKITSSNKLAYSLISGTPDLSVYAKTSDMPSLSGYATQSWVENKGYLLATTASNTYQPKITSSSKLAYSLISGTPDLSVYALKTSIPTKLSDLTDDVVAGNYLSTKGGTINGSITATSFIGNLTGTADSAKRLRYVEVNSNQGDLNTILEGGGIAYNYASTAYWINAPSGARYGSCIEFTSRNSTSDSANLAGQLMWDVNHNSTTDATRSLWFRAADTNGWTNSKWHQIAFTDSNVASATKLKTARSIWGQSFDGTKDVTGAMTVNGDATFSSKVIIGTIPVYQSADGTLYVDANVVFRGGVAMYGSSTTTINEE